MKHLLNNLTESEKKAILEQYGSSLIVETSRFKKLMGTKLGDVKPLVEDRETLARDFNSEFKILFQNVGDIKMYYDRVMKGGDIDTIPVLTELQKRAITLKMGAERMMNIIEQLKTLSEDYGLDYLKRNFDPTLYSTDSDFPEFDTTKMIEELKIKFDEIAEPLIRMNENKTFSVINEQLPILKQKVEDFIDFITDFKNELQS